MILKKSNQKAIYPDPPYRFKKSLGSSTLDLLILGRSQTAAPEGRWGAGCAWIADNEVCVGGGRAVVLSWGRDVEGNEEGVAAGILDLSPEFIKPHGACESTCEGSVFHVSEGEARRELSMSREEYPGVVSREGC